MNQPSSKPEPSTSAAELVTLDCDHILTRAGGDPELLARICDVLLREIPVHLEALRAAVKKRDVSRVARQLPPLRTCLSIVGSVPLSLTVETLECAIRERRTRRMLGAWKQLNQQLGMLVPQVQRLMLEVTTPRSAVQ